jgi:hypothetical protein
MSALKEYEEPKAVSKKCGLFNNFHFVRVNIRTIGFSFQDFFPFLLCVDVFASATSLRTGSTENSSCGQFHQHFICAFAPIFLRQKKFKPKM